LTGFAGVGARNSAAHDFGGCLTGGAGRGAAGGTTPGEACAAVSVDVSGCVFDVTEAGGACVVLSSGIWTGGSEGGLEGSAF
jgi:hypothetical protein